MRAVNREMVTSVSALTITSAAAVWLTAQLHGLRYFRIGIQETVPALSSVVFNTVEAEVLTSTFAVIVAAILGGLVGVAVSDRSIATSLLVLPCVPLVAALAITAIGLTGQNAGLLVLPFALPALVAAAFHKLRWRWVAFAWVLFFCSLLIPHDNFRMVQW